MLDGINNFISAMGIIFISTLSIRLFLHFKLVFKRIKNEIINDEKRHNERDTKGRVFLTLISVVVYAILAVPSLVGVILVVPIFLCCGFELLVHAFEKETKNSIPETEHEKGMRYSFLFVSRIARINEMEMLEFIETAENQLKNDEKSFLLNEKDNYDILSKCKYLFDTGRITDEKYHEIVTLLLNSINF